MKIEDIQIFLKLCNTLSFFSTADEMFLSPSAVTYAIKSLEKQLNVKLFRRSSHSVELTEKGKIFSRDMRSMMATWEFALEHLREDAAGQSALSIGIISMTLQKDFSNIISRFIVENPNVQPMLSVCPVDDPTEPLRKGKQEIAFVYQDALIGHPHLKHMHLVSIPIYCVMSRKNPLAKADCVMLEDLRGQTLFGLPPSVNATVSGLRRLSECIGSIGDGSITTIISDDHHYCLSMAEENCGMTFAPVFPSTLRNTETLVYKPFRDPELLLDIHIVWKTDPLSATAQSLVNIAQDYFSGS